jgi:hypothetical protein
MLAILGAQAVATLIAVYGILLPAMGWGLAAFVCVYALVAFVITDALKRGEIFNASINSPTYKKLLLTFKRILVCNLVL